MLTAKLLFISAALLGVTVTDAATCSTLQQNVDYSGADVGSAYSASANGCCNICASKSGCGAFTWTNYNGGTCWLKAGKGTAKSNPGAVSGVVQTSSSSTCSTLENNVDYSGTDVGSATSASASGCCSICSGRSGCGAFTWTNYNGGTCWLKSGKGTAKSNPGAVSGVVQGGSTSTPVTPSGSVAATDPTQASYPLSAFAIGDWGTTPYKGSCCSRTNSYNNYDVVAEDVVASLMNTQAGNSPVKPKVIIGHGDNFYWTGINSASGRDSQFTQTFEEKFNGANIKTIPWVNVLGNHDYGGASYVCENGARCANTAAILQGIDNKFNWQATYTSPNDNRWILKDHFYVHRIEDAATGISIDIFNIDTNDADIHGASQICCQCYGYSNGDSATCRNVGRGHQYCIGGDTAAYDSCVAKFNAWGDSSRAQIAEKVKQSTATWKIVNSHYSAYNHYVEYNMKKWFDILRGSGVHVWLNGHTHGEKHDYSSSLGIHFFENGAGGGIQKESASGIPAYAAPYVKNLWTYGSNEYGFMSLQASKNWIKMQYHTADNNWQFGQNFQSTKVGGVQTKHCWYIPADGTQGRSC